MRSNDIVKLIGALLVVQKGITVVKKNSRNPFFKSNYADLEGTWAACRQILCDNDLVVTQMPDIAEDGQAVLVTQISHTSGQWMSSRLPLTPIKQDPQAQGSALTYARRYALQSMIGLSPSDDDGETAMSRNKKTERPRTSNHKNEAMPEPCTDKQKEKVIAMSKACGWDHGRLMSAIYEKYPNAFDQDENNNLVLDWKKISKSKAGVLIKTFDEIVAALGEPEAKDETKGRSTG